MNEYSYRQLVGRGRATEQHFRLQFVRALHGGGFTDHEVAEILDVTVRTAANYRRRLNLPVHRKPRATKKTAEQQTQPGISLRLPGRGLPSMDAQFSELIRLMKQEQNEGTVD